MDIFGGTLFCHYKEEGCRMRQCWGVLRREVRWCDGRNSFHCGFEVHITTQPYTHPWFWTSHLRTLSLSIFIYKMGIKITASQKTSGKKYSLNSMNRCLAKSKKLVTAEPLGASRGAKGNRAGKISRIYTVNRLECQILFYRPWSAIKGTDWNNSECLEHSPSK